MRRFELVDTHCHLQFKDYEIDRAVVISDAVSAGVTKMVCVGTSVDDSQSAISLAEEYPNIWAAAGEHPHRATEFLATTGSANLLEQLLSHPKMVATGEIGLDYYRMHSPKKDQLEALKIQMQIGRQVQKPFVFHIREAFDDFWPIYDQFGGGAAGVGHSFSDSATNLHKAVERGLHVALNGIMTYTKNSDWLEAAKRVPLDRLVLETDAPFLAPADVRGQRCEPKNIKDIAELLAGHRGESVEDLANATTKNAVSLFGL